MIPFNYLILGIMLYFSVEKKAEYEKIYISKNNGSFNKFSLFFYNLKLYFRYKKRKHFN